MPISKRPPEAYAADQAAIDTQLAVRDMARSFGETRALDSATLTLRRGEIHALAGENGSGKSTLIKILSGVIRPDGGEFMFQGSRARFASPYAAQHAGISTVYQETLITPEMSVRDNIFFGTDGLIRHQRSKSQEISGAHLALDQLGLPGLDIDRPMWTLSLAERQLVTVARAIVRPWQVLILDEGTSALDAHRRDRLFAYLRDASSEGKSVLFTSHRMDEVFDLAQRITVLRNGTTVATVNVAESSYSDVLQHMSGREQAAALMEETNGGSGEVRSAPSALAQRPARSGEPVLRVSDVTLRASSQPMSIELKRGEILGIAGLEGQGQVELVEALCGLSRPRGGRVIVVDDAGRDHEISSYRDANRRGVRYVPRDRRQEGLFASQSVFDNFAIASWGELNRFGILKRGAARKRYQEYAEYTRLVGSPNQPVSTLSGGNQQKVLLGRWTSMHPKVLVLNDPLRGVDANTKEELYQFFRSLAAEGMALVFLSTEIGELLVLTDRIAVIHEGSMQALLPTAEATNGKIVAAMFGQNPEEES